ncbi:MAG: ABC transporter permease [Chloroflexi bacterium]|nr:MAG: ABC transporter permease [Chloroflexota bacterium]
MSTPTSATASAWLERLRSGGIRVTNALSLLAIFIIIALVFSVLSPYFLTVDNFINIGRTLPVIGIIAIGETLVLIAGGVDLSVGSVAALSGVVTGLLWERAGLPIGLAALAGVSSGALVGLINGLLVTRLRINALISTLATFSIVRGLAFVLTNAQMNQLTDPRFLFLGRGDILGVPVPFILMSLLYVVFIFVLRRTPFGRDLYAIGGNPMAARLAGIASRRNLLVVFVVSGILAGFGGLVQASQLAAGARQAAVGLEFTVIAAVVLGGTSLAGGKGTLVGTFFGVIILRTLDNGLILTNVSSYYQIFARGAVLILAVGFDQLRTRWAERR